MIGIYFWNLLDFILVVEVVFSVCIVLDMVDCVVVLLI